MPRDESMQRTRAALVRAALELFAEQGLDAPSLDAICERAGYTRGAFYIHFADREALLVAVMDQVGEAFLASVFQRLAAAPGSAEASGLRGAIRRFVDAAERGAYPMLPGSSEHGRTAPLVRPHQLLDACARSPVVRDRYRMLVEASIAEVARLAREDQTSGQMRADADAEATGALLLATVIGAQTMVELGVRVDADKLARTIEAMLASEPSGAASPSRRRSTRRSRGTSRRG